MNDEIEGFEKSQLSQNLKILSERKNISISRLANKVGMNVSTLHNYFCGVNPRNIDSLLKIAQFFEVSLDELLSKELSYISEGFQKKKGFHFDDFEIILEFKRK